MERGEKIIFTIAWLATLIPPTLLGAELINTKLTTDLFWLGGFSWLVGNIVLGGFLVENKKE